MSADPTRTNPHATAHQSTIPVNVVNAEVATVSTAAPPVGEREHSPTTSTTAATVSVPGYEIQGELGRGGMGVVYKARQMALNRTVALKMVLSGAEGHKELIRFLAEAEAVAAVKHPNVVQVHDFGEANGKPFMALEYLSGGNLAERFSASAGREDSTVVVGLVSHIARGVAAAHEQGIVHRDLKPGNVLLDELGNPKVTDFGLAKRGGGSNLTETKAIMGTPAYMSPEQASGGAKFVGPPADVWALGVILYEGLTGARPFSGDNVQGLLSHILTGEPISVRKRVATVPRDLELICLKCLLKQPQERYPTARELADDLERFSRGEPISVRSAGPLERGVKWAKRNKLVAGALAVGVLALVVGSAVSVAFGVEARQQASRANEEASRANGEASRADQERDAAVDARNDLKRASEKLEKANVELNDALARALISPISPKDSTLSIAELTPYEVEAFWELATRRGTPVNRRFLEEATRLPLSSKQLGGRAEFSIHAAIGINPELREQTEQLILSRVKAPNITQEHRASLIHAWTTDESASPAVAAELANALLGDLDKTTERHLAVERARTLLALAKRMEPQAAAKVCAAGAKPVTEQLWKTTDPVHVLKFAKVLAVTGQALQTSAGAVECKSVAKIFATLMAEATDWKDVYALTEVLALLAGRMEPASASAVCDIVATPLIESLRNIQQHESLYAITRALASLMPYLKPTRVAQIRREVAVVLSGVMKRTQETEPLVVLASAIQLVAERGAIPEKDRIAKSIIAAMRAASKAPEIKPHTFQDLAMGLVMICEEMEPATTRALCGTASNLLVEVIARDADPTNFGVLAVTLTLLTEQLDPKAAAEAHGRAAASIVARAVNPATNPEIAELRLSLWNLTGRLEPQAAAALARQLIDALLQAKEPKVRGRIASCLAVLGTRLEPGAATAVAKTIADTMGQLTGDPGTTWLLALGLSSAAESMEPKAAATLCAEVVKTLTPASTKPHGHFASYTLWRMADARVLLAKSMDSDAAIAVFGTAATDIIESQFTHTALESRPLSVSLGEALFRGDSSRVRRNPAFAVGAMSNPTALLGGLPLLQLATQPKPLPPQMLVDLLKHPFCVRESRRLVLDALSFTYGRPFADRWEFVQFVRDNKLPLDLTTPPKRPQSGDTPAQ